MHEDMEGYLYRKVSLNTVVGVHINAMKTTIVFSFYFLMSFFQLISILHILLYKKLDKKLDRILDKKLDKN